MRAPKSINVNRAASMAEADKKEDGDIIMTRFRCADLNCNTLLTKEDHALGRCGGCQGVRFLVARYITEAEDEQIKAGTLHPHEVDLDVIGVEPPAPREVR